MSLQEQLDELKSQFESTAPPEALAIMHRATDELLESDIMNGVLKTGERAPDFSLTDHNGNQISASDLLAKGPLVVGFYRGIW